MSAHPQRQLYEKVGPVRYGWWLFWLKLAGPLHRKGDPYKGVRWRFYLFLLSVAQLSTR